MYSRSSAVKLSGSLISRPNLAARSMEISLRSSNSLIIGIASAARLAARIVVCCCLLNFDWSLGEVVSVKSVRFP